MKPTAEYTYSLKDVIDAIHVASRSSIPDDGTFSTAQAAAELGCSAGEIYKLAKAGKIKQAKKIGREPRWLAGSVRRCNRGAPESRQRAKAKRAGESEAIRALKVGG